MITWKKKIRARAIASYVNFCTFPEVFIDAGSRNEIPFKSGVSHLLSRVAIQVV